MKKYTIKHTEDVMLEIQDNAIHKVDEILKERNNTSYVILCDKTTYDLFGNNVEESLKRLDKPVHKFIIEPGEKSKTLKTAEEILSFLLEKSCDRKTAIIAVGGGVISDLATFIAGIYYRGVDCIQIPTTLLAQVDAAVGGKGGVNIGEYKNIVGVVKQPNIIVIDPNVLSLLPKDQIASGMAEIIKIAIAFDKNFFRYLFEAKDLSQDVLRKAIDTSVDLKMKIVMADPLEKTNTRTAVNFGHSLGHAIELMAGIPHGFAVAIGMVYAMEVSTKVTNFPKKDMEQALKLLQRYHLPINIKNLKKEDVLEHMKKDKKNFGGNFRLVLLEKIGKLIVVENIDKKIIEESFERVLL